MSIVLDFAPETETRLKYEASRKGLTLDAYVRQAVEQSLPTDTVSPPALDVVASDRERKMQEMIQAMAAAPISEWGERGQELWEFMTPDEREADDAEFEELMAALEENRRYPGEPAPVKHA